MRKFLATLALGLALAFGAPDAAEAQQVGLVNVEVGDVTILENVAVGLAINVAAAICGVQVGQVGILAAQVLRTQEQQTVCTIEDQEGNVENVIIAPN